MQTLNFNSQQLIDEMTDYADKLSAGFSNLTVSEPIESGVTEKQVIYREDKLTLYRYSGSSSKDINPVPLLIVYALVNRPYMVDLQADRSTVRNLIEQGQDVYLIDWGYPDDADFVLTLDDYINGYIDRCVDAVCEQHDIKKINLLGICQGGSLSLCYTSLHQNKVRNLLTMVTPVDFKTPDNLLSAWVQNIDIDTLVDTLGNIPGELLNTTFLSLKPFLLTGQKYIDMVDILHDTHKLKNFLRMEKWIFDSPDQAGLTFKQFLIDFYQYNGFINGGIMLGNHKVDLRNIHCPILNIFAEQDHLVPPAASKALRGLTSSADYDELSFSGGHIGIYVSGKAQALVTPAISQWLTDHSK